MGSRFPAVSFQCIASATPLGDDCLSQEKIKQALLSTTLVICATSSSSPLFPSSWICTGTHVILIGSFTPSMREVDTDLIQRALRQPGTCKGVQQILLVDSREACAAEAGELIDAAVEASQLSEIGEFVTVTGSGV
jgi:ornithine cyclodeaminase/alanine dehydrogenase-like protein (mu-crystallin family)